MNKTIGAIAAAAVAYYYLVVVPQQQEQQQQQQQGSQRTSQQQSRTQQGQEKTDLTHAYSICQAVRQQKRNNPNAVATVSYSGKKFTYAEFHDRVQAVGSAVNKNLGIKKGERIAILSLNSFKYLEILFAAPWGGQWVVPLNIRLAAPEIAENLNDCTATAICVDDAFLPLVPKLKELIPTLKHFIYIGEKNERIEGLHHYELDLVEKGKQIAQPASDVGGDDVFGIFYTGGTTGRSKGVMLTHRNICVNAYSALLQLKYDENTRYIHCAPMFHLADGASSFALTMVGAQHYFMPKFVPNETLKLVEHHKITHLLLVPTMVAMVLQDKDIDKTDFSKLTHVLYGASPMPETVLKTAMKKMKCNFTAGYGMTETAPLLTFLSPEDHLRGMNGDKPELLKSCGKSVPHVELKIVDEDDNEVERGVVGELIARGPNVMKGYYQQESKTAHALKNGWMHTGDGAKMDDEGFVYIQDRIKDMIVSGGENVYSVEVENAISKLEGVAMCAVIGTPDEKLVEKVTAIIVPKPEFKEKLTPQSVISHCKGLIANYKCPRQVVFQDEPLPLSGAGKILKTKLREPFWKNQQGVEIYSNKEGRKTEYS